MKFYLLNVFTRDGKNGNQLAAIHARKSLTTQEMQKIAAEFNFSESIFLDSEDPTKIRIFTPKVEYPFAGHPTVGAGWLIHHLGIRKNNFSIHVPLGEVKIESNASTFVTFPGVPVISEFTINDVLPFTDVELAGIRTVNAGPEFTFLPMKSHGALKKAVLPPGNHHRYYLFYKHDPSHYSVRMFGAKEDAATGSAACALAAYLKEVRHEEEGTVTISQGSEMNRECELKLIWNHQRIQVGGAVTLWGEGNLS